MKIIDDVITRIEELDGSGASQVLADALASACHSKYKVSMLDVSVKLDKRGKQYVLGLMQISSQHDFSNADQ